MNFNSVVLVTGWVTLRQRLHSTGPQSCEKLWYAQDSGGGGKCDHKDPSSATFVSQGGLPTWTVWCLVLAEGTARAQGLGLIFLVLGPGCGGS